MQPHAENAGPLTVSGLALWPEKRRVEWQGRPIELTSMEFNLLEVLMRNAGRVVKEGPSERRSAGRSRASSAAWTST